MNLQFFKFGLIKIIYQRSKYQATGGFNNGKD